MLKVEEQKGQQKQTREDIKMSNMKVQNLLEDHNNNLDVARDACAAMVMALVDVGDIEVFVILNTNVKAQECLIKAFQTLAEQGQVEFDRVHKDIEFMNNNLFSLE